VIEIDMVRRMTRSAAVVLPFLVVGLWLWDGGEAALSGAIGLVMALANLWLAARVIGGVAETNPQLLVGAAMVAFALGLGGLTALALGLQAMGILSFPVTGLTLVGAHLACVLWEGGRNFPMPSVARPPGKSALKGGR
jgi:hypothetical protein